MTPQPTSLGAYREARQYGVTPEDVELINTIKEAVVSGCYREFCRHVMQRGYAGDADPQACAALLQMAGVVQDHHERHQGRVIPFPRS